MRKIRVLVADDHFVVREGLAHMLATVGEFEVVGQAADGQEAVRLTEKFQPDVVLLDIQMPRLDGIEAACEIKKRVPAAQVVMLSTFDEGEYIYQSIQAGAKGYVLKNSALNELVEVIRAASRGELLLSPNIANRLAKCISTPRRGQNLTRRERDVLYLLTKGFGNKEIAQQLQTTEQTAKTHVSHIIAKMGVKSRTEVVSRALKEKLVKSD